MFAVSAKFTDYWIKALAPYEYGIQKYLSTLV
jgi:hypothetical protein